MPEEYEFIKDFECLGKWWLPGQDKNNFFGKLKFNINNGGEIELVSEVQFNIVYLSSPILSLILFGSTDKGDITLFDCRFIKNDHSPDGKLFTALFKFSEGIIGAHVKNKEDFKIQKLAVNYSYLNAWCDSYGIQLEKAYFHLLAKGGIVFETHKPFLLIETNDYEIRLGGVDEGRASSTDTDKQITLKETTYIEILLQSKNTRKDYQEFINSIQYFLTLAVREQVFPLVFIGTTDDGKQLKYFQRLSAILVSNPLLIANFALSDIEENINEYLQNWLDNRDKLSSACELYFSSLNDNLTLKLRFLYLVQAIEALHRSFFIKKSKYPLVERLKHMFNDTYLELINQSEVILEKKDIGPFIEKIIYTRNYYTHYNERLKDKIFKEEELYHAVIVLNALAEIILMSVIGFSSKKIADLRQHPHILWLEFRNKI